MIANLCGFRSVSSIIKESIVAVIAGLKRAKKVQIIDGSLIELVENKA